MAEFVIGAAVACLVTLMLFSTGALAAVVMAWAGRKSERIGRRDTDSGEGS